MRILLYLLLASFLILSCEKDEGINDLNIIIQPLKVGYSWTFIDSTFTNEGILTKVDKSTVAIIGSEIANYEGKEIELFYWKWDDFDRIWLKAIEGGSVYNYGLRENDISYLFRQSLNQPYPVNIGDTWSRFEFSLREENDSIFGIISDTTEIECIYTNYNFSTMVGDLKCIVSLYAKKLGNDLSETIIYYSPNIGYVGLENKVNNKVTYKKTLMNYNFADKQDLEMAMKSAQTKNDKGIASDFYGMMIRKIANGSNCPSHIQCH